MIKIIDPVPCASVVKQCLCRNCGVKLEYTPSDVSKRTVTDYTGGTDLVRFIVCPGCAYQVTVR